MENEDYTDAIARPSTLVSYSQICTRVSLIKVIAYGLSIYALYLKFMPVLETNIGIYVRQIARHKIKLPVINLILSRDLIYIYSLRFLFCRACQNRRRAARGERVCWILTANTISATNRFAQTEI